MAVYSVLIDDEVITVLAFLSEPGLDPSISDPATTVPLLIECEGIVHYTRSGERYVISAADEEIGRGDFLFVADHCPTGEAETVVASVTSRDYAFILPRDAFGTHAEHYMNRRPSTTAITACRSLNSILRAMCYPDADSRSLARHITAPINNIVIVSHSGAGGVLFCRLRNDSSDTQIFLDHLCPYVHDTSRPVVTNRIMQNTSDTNVYIRGCNVGRSPQFLRFIKDIFGDEITVTAPLHEDRFMTFRDGRTIYRFEFMRKCFKIARSERASNRGELVSLFQGLSTTDIHGTEITSEQWDSWIPDNIHPPRRQETNYSCTIPFHGRARVQRFYRYRDRNLYFLSITSEGTIPAEHSDRVEIVREVLRGEETMADDYPGPPCRFPMYQRWGFESIDDFVDGLRWTFTTSGSTLRCRGGLYEYEVRIPITDTGGTLMLNAFLSTGDREYLPDCHSIVETNTALFASV